MSGRLYSVIIPTYNGADKLDTVLSALARQSVDPSLFEVVVVDDASVDGTERIVTACAKRHPAHSFRYLRQPHNGGPAKARNTGVRSSEGAIIFFTDDDCEPPALWMEKHLRVYATRDDVAAVGGWYAPRRAELERAGTLFVYLFYDFIFKGAVDGFEGDSTRIDPRLFPAINTANLSVRRKVLEEVGLFDETFVAPGSEDLELSERIRERGFVMYYMPLLMPHRKPLGILGLMKMARNRAKGRAVYHHLLAKRGIKRREPPAWMHWRAFMAHAATSVKRKKGARRTLFLLSALSFLYFLAVYSKTARAYWRRKLKLRAL